MNKLLAMYVAVAVVFCAGLYLHVSKPSAKSEVQKWTLVVDKTTYKGEALTDLDLMWVISPKGEWFSVPEAQKARFRTAKKGEHVQLPDSAPLWDRVIVAPGRVDSARLQMGLPVSRPNKLNPEIDSRMIASHFYSRS
jgi:hypothetical protein